MSDKIKNSGQYMIAKDEKKWGIKVEGIKNTKQNIIFRFSSSQEFLRVYRGAAVLDDGFRHN